VDSLTRLTVARITRRWREGRHSIGVERRVEIDEVDGFNLDVS
jgi:hypothetical protein